jgi:hypothetical protein
MVGKPEGGEISAGIKSDGETEEKKRNEIHPESDFGLLRFCKIQIGRE